MTLKVELLQVRVELGVMAMIRYSTLPRSPELEPHSLIAYQSHPPTQFFFFAYGLIEYE